MIQSPAIQSALQIALSYGNEVGEISEGWSEVKQVVHMRKPLSAALKEAILADGKLRHWSSPSSPHNSADEGFTDDAEKISMAFPA